MQKRHSKPSLSHFLSLSFLPFPLKFSISSHPGWQDGTIKVTLFCTKKRPMSQFSLIKNFNERQLWLIKSLFSCSFWKWEVPVKIQLLLVLVDSKTKTHKGNITHTKWIILIDRRFLGQQDNGETKKIKYNDKAKKKVMRRGGKMRPKKVGRENGRRSNWASPGPRSSCK